MILDTLEKGTDSGVFCEKRLKWLKKKLEEHENQTIYLFMHHPPFDLHFPCIDRIGLKDKEGNMEEREERDEKYKKERKEEPWRRGKKGMNTREGKEGLWKRGQKGMKTTEGEEEPWKKRKAKPEKGTKGLPIKWKRTKHSRKIIQQKLQQKIQQ